MKIKPATEKERDEILRKKAFKKAFDQVEKEFGLDRLYTDRDFEKRFKLDKSTEINEFSKKRVKRELELTEKYYKGLKKEQEQLRRKS